MGAKYGRMTSNPEVMNGQPTIRGMRLTVRRVIEAVALYPSRAVLKSEYPELEAEDIRRTSVAFAADDLDDQVIWLGTG